MSVTIERIWEEAYTATGTTGKRRVGIICPFCGVITDAYVWSLAGSGKRCRCGAKFSWRGQVATKESTDD